MEQVGFSLVDVTNNEAQHWGDFSVHVLAPPTLIMLPNGYQIAGARIGDTYVGGYRFVARWLDRTLSDGSVTFDGTKTIVALTPQQAQNEYAQTTETARLSEFLQDAGYADLIGRLQTATLAQIDTWLANNVTTLAQARVVLAAIIKFLVARRLF